MPLTLEQSIEKTIGEVRLDTLDISFGELMSLFRNGELVIQPEFQRYYRWDEDQKSRLVESVILQLPIPQVFVVELASGVFELIDGLQRISSVIQFVEPDLLEMSPLILEGCDLVTRLNSYTYEKLPLRLKLRIKRASVRMVVIKHQSTPILKYEMFKRLNTGGTDLSDQEIRNCTSRMAGDSGTVFYDFLAEQARHESFVKTTESLPDGLREKRGDEELVLRFFALKEASALFKGSVKSWLDNFMESIVLQHQSFDYADQRADFARLFDLLESAMGEDAFVRHRGSKPIGALAPSHFEAITLGCWQVIDRIEELPPTQIRQTIVDAIQTQAFKDNIGPGSNSLAKFNGRVDAIRAALEAMADGV